MSLGRSVLLAAIRGYKRHISPHKGYACAYRVHTGGCSCSTLGLRAISRYGAWRGLGVLRLRFAECRVANEALRQRRFVPRQTQAGFIDCDLPCDASCIDLPSCDICDVSACDGPSEFCACLDFGDCCDWGGSDKPSESRQVRRQRRRGDPVVIEPGPDLPPLG